MIANICLFPSISSQAQKQSPEDPEDDLAEAEDAHPGEEPDRPAKAGHLVRQGHPQLPLEVHDVLAAQLELDVGRGLQRPLADLETSSVDAKHHGLKVPHQHWGL